MIYANRSDLLLRFGLEEITQLEDMGNTGLPDVSVSDTALMDASQEIDGYIASRYNLPLPSVPVLLKRVACDMARYRMYYQRSTAEVKERHEQAIQWLTKVSKGTVLLTFAVPLTPAETLLINTTPVSSIAVGKSDIGGVFNDILMAKMPGPI